MIELKLSTVNAGILLATSRYFGDLAAALGGAQVHDNKEIPAGAVFSVKPAPVVGETVITASNVLPLAVNNVDEEDDAPTPLPLAVNNVDDEDDAPTPPIVGAPQSLAAVGVELDSEGYPWDHRIHASTKTKIADGSWKVKRGIDTTLIDQVRAEFDRAASVPAGMVPPIPQAAAVEPVPSQPAPTPTPPVVIAPAPAGTEKPTNPAILFTTTLKLYAEAVAAGKIAEGSGEAWAKQVGLPSLASLVARPDLCGQFYDQLKALLS